MSQLALETGAQLVARLTSSCRPQIQNLDSIIFPNHGPYPKEVVEISGDTDVGKTTLLMHIMAKLILPSEYGGKNGRVLIFLTDYNFDMEKLVCILEKLINENDQTATKTLNETNIYNVITTSLQNITFQRCFDETQFELGLLGLDELLSNNNQYCLLAIDSIGAFYWTSRKEKFGIKFNMKDFFQRLTRFAHQYHLVVIYTKPAYFPCNCNFNGTAIADYLLELIRHDDVSMDSHFVYKIYIRKTNQTVLHNYKFDEEGIIIWTK